MSRDIIVFGGVNFIRYPGSKNQSDTRYFKGRWRINGKLTKTTLHRAMWTDANGPIPAGYHIHHKDGNHLNNVLGNFECVLPAKHLSDHYLVKSDEYKEKNTATLLTVGQEAAKEWHRSEAGREWHSRNAKTYRDSTVKEFNCIECGILVQRALSFGGKAHFCGDRCRKRSAARTFRAKKKATT